MNGIRDLSTGRFHSLEDRASLKEPMIQKLLGSHHLCSQLTCGCRELDGVALPLRPRRLPQCKSLTLSRDDVDAHKCGCFLSFESDTEKNERVRSSNIFGPIVHHFPMDSTHEKGGDSYSRKCYESFELFSKRALSTGLTDAYTTRNAGRAHHANPTPFEVFDAVHNAIERTVSTSQESPFEAANRFGFTLRIGLVLDRISSVLPNKSLMNVYWWDSVGLQFDLVSSMPSAILPAIGALKMRSGYRPSPYFIAAVQDSEGTLQRVFFQSIALGNEYLLPVDSSRESFFADHLIRKNATVFKPFLHDDMMGMFREFDVRFDQEIPRHLLPDFLVFWRTPQAGTTLQIRELRGFRRGDLEAYDQNLDQKQEFYENLKGSLPIIYKEINGTRFKWKVPLDELESWLAANSSFGSGAETDGGRSEAGREIGA